MKYFKSLSIIALLVFGSFQGVTKRVSTSSSSLERNENVSLCPPNYAQLPARYNISPGKWAPLGDIPLLVLCPVIPTYMANGACCLPIKPE
jgi:hypothetical protein